MDSFELDSGKVASDTSAVYFDASAPVGAGRWGSKPWEEEAGRLGDWVLDLHADWDVKDSCGGYWMTEDDGSERVKGIGRLVVVVVVVVVVVTRGEW